VGENALNGDRIKSLDYRQTLEQKGTLAVVVSHLRNAPSKVAEKLESSDINRSQCFNGNCYKSVCTLYMYGLVARILTV